MRDILVDLNILDTKVIFSENYIKEGENKASNLVIILSPEFIDVAYSYKIKFKLNDNIPVLTEDLVPVDDVINYTLTNVNTFELGSLRCEVQAYDIENTLMKSATITLNIIESVDGLSVEVPTDYEIYIHLIEHYMDNDLYDPTLKEIDVYDMTNMDEGTVNKIYTVTERAKLDGIIGDSASTPNTYVVRDTDSGFAIGHIDYDLTPATTPYIEGRFQWDDDNKTLNIGVHGDNVAMQIGQDQVLWATNNSGVILNIGTVVSLVGNVSGRPAIVQADADGTLDEQNTLGIVSGGNIEIGESGYVSLVGIVSHLDTSAFEEGETLYLSAVKGQITNIKPSQPSVTTVIGMCLVKAGGFDGKIYVRIKTEAHADRVGVYDVGDYFTGETVELALAELGELTKPSYGEIYVFNANAPQTIPNGIVFTKITPFMADGDYLNCNPDGVNQQIIIIRAGYYKVTTTFSSHLGSNGNILETALFKNDLIVNKLYVIRKLVIAGEPSTGGATGIVYCDVDDVLDIRVRHDRIASVELTVRFGNVNIEKIG